MLSDVAQAALPSRSQVDGWLQQMGDSDTFDAAKGVNWGVMPGPFYTPELGLGIGTAIVGMYRPDPADSVSQVSTLSLSGYFSSTGAFGVSLQNYIFFAEEHWRFFLNGALSDTPTYYWGQGFTAGDKDSHKQAYTAQVLDLQPTLYRRLVNNIYLGIGWTLDVQHASQIDDDDPPRIQSTAQGRSSVSNDDGRWLPSAGVGYRFEFKPRVNVRLDYGVGKGSSGFYFQVGEAF